MESYAKQSEACVCSYISADQAGDFDQSNQDRGTHCRRWQTAQRLETTKYTSYHSAHDSASCCAYSKANSIKPNSRAEVSVVHSALAVIIASSGQSFAFFSPVLVHTCTCLIPRNGVEGNPEVERAASGGRASACTISVVGGMCQSLFLVPRVSSWIEGLLCACLYGLRTAGKGVACRTAILRPSSRPCQEPQRVGGGCASDNKATTPKPIFLVLGGGKAR